MKTKHILLVALLGGGTWWLWKRHQDGKLFAPAPVTPGMLPAPAPRVRKNCRSGSIALT